MRAPLRHPGAALTALVVAVLLPLVAAPEPATGAPPAPVGGPELAAAGVVAHPTRTVPPPPVVGAVAYVVADLGTGQVLAAKAPHARLLPASTLKTLTALTLLDRLDKKQVYVVTQADANIEGTRVGLFPRRPYTVEQLFQGLLMASGNDAASALANVAGGPARTVALMNATARRLGAHDTVAVNPSGLDAARQTSSAYDLALITRAAMQHPDFRRYVSTRRVAFPGKGVPGNRSYEVGNHNRFLFNYPGAIGVKNGYTVRARQTLVAAAQRGGRTLVVTLLGTRRSAWREAAPLMDWGYRADGRVRPVGRLVEPGEVADTAVPAPAAGDPADAADTAAAPGDPAPPPAAEGTGEVVRSGAPVLVPLFAAAALLLALVRLRRRARVRRRR